MNFLMNESDIEENIFYLRRVHIVPTNFDGEVEVRYQSSKQVYRGITQLGCFYQGTLPVRNLLPNIKKGLTLVEAIAGEVFEGRSELLVHVEDLVTKSAIGQPHDEPLTEQS